MNPIQKEQKCYGDDLRELKEIPQFTLRYFINWYQKFEQSTDFLTRIRWFNLLIGNDEVIKMIQSGKSENEIRESWQKELSEYKKIRSKYLLYKSA